jgi:DnaJ-class molecular chaperone
MRDPYQVLGVPKSASAADIKSAFRKLAKKYHPDQSADPKAKEKFAEASGAYEIIGDDKKRGAFDRGEIDAEGKPRAPQFEGFGAGRRGAGGFNFDAGGGDFSRGAGFEHDIFSELFGARGGRHGGGFAARGEDHAVTAIVPLEQVATGGPWRVILPTGKSLDVDIPAGVEEGKAIRLRGQGAPGAGGGPAGDAMVTVRYAEHPIYKVAGRDLRLQLPVTLYEAVLGAKVRVPTLYGAVEAKIPAGSSSGRTLRFRGKGLPGHGKLAAGDLFAEVRIALPQGEEADLEALMQEWRDKKPYDPRSAMG